MAKHEKGREGATPNRDKMTTRQHAEYMAQRAAERFKGSASIHSPDTRSVQKSQYRETALQQRRKKMHKGRQ